MQKQYTKHAEHVAEQKTCKENIGSMHYWQSKNKFHQNTFKHDLYGIFVFQGLVNKVEIVWRQAKNYLAQGGNQHILLVYSRMKGKIDSKRPMQCVCGAGGVQLTGLESVNAVSKSWSNLQENLPSWHWELPKLWKWQLKSNVPNQ